MFRPNDPRGEQEVRKQTAMWPSASAKEPRQGDLICSSNPSCWKFASTKTRHSSRTFSSRRKKAGRIKHDMKNIRKSISLLICTVAARLPPNPNIPFDFRVPNLGARRETFVFLEKKNIFGKVRSGSSKSWWKKVSLFALCDSQRVLFTKEGTSLRRRQPWRSWRSDEFAISRHFQVKCIRFSANTAFGVLKTSCSLCLKPHGLRKARQSGPHFCVNLPCTQHNSWILFCLSRSFPLAC